MEITLFHNLRDGSGKDICAWDAASGERLAEFVGDSWDASIGVFPDGSRIVSAGGQAGQGAGSLRVWDFVTGESLLTLRGHEHQVLSVAVSQDGRRIVSGAVNGWVRIWDTPPDYRPPGIASKR